MCPQGFNEGLEELCKIQKGWAIPDKEQRDFIRQAQRRVVSEAYRAFLHRWGRDGVSCEGSPATPLMLHYNTSTFHDPPYYVPSHVFQMCQHLLHQEP